MEAKVNAQLVTVVTFDQFSEDSRVSKTCQISHRIQWQRWSIFSLESEKVNILNQNMKQQKTMRKVPAKSIKKRLFTLT
jgi:ribosomal protein L23